MLVTVVVVVVVSRAGTVRVVVTVVVVVVRGGTVTVAVYVVSVVVNTRVRGSVVVGVWANEGSRREQAEDMTSRATPSRKGGRTTSRRTTVLGGAVNVGVVVRVVTVVVLDRGGMSVVVRLKRDRVEKQTFRVPCSLLLGLAAKTPNKTGDPAHQHLPR